MRIAVESLSQDKHLNDISKWLNPPDPSKNLNAATEKRYKGTGSWFLEGEQFREWRSGSRPCLWLHGLPGCGKTVLSSTIIDALSQRNNSSTIVLDYFFDFSDTNKQSVDMFLRSLAAQLYIKSQDSREELDNLYLTHESGKRQPTTELIFNSFQSMLRFSDKVQIVIDALDECKRGERRELISRIEVICGAKHTNTSLLVTSRKEEDIEWRITCWLSEKDIISIQQQAVDVDIRAYIEGTLHAERGEFQRWKSQPSVLKDIETRLVEKADGM
jgi:NACHT domain